MRLASCLLLVGCTFDHGVATSDAPRADAPVDTTDGPKPDAPCESYSSLFDTCTNPMGDSPLMLSGTWTYNTDSHELSQGIVVMMPKNKVFGLAAGPLDVIFVSSFTLQMGATLRVVGPTNGRAFGIASTGPVQIDGVIDASSGGAGARDPAACGTAVGKAGGNNSGGAGGGGGGAFRGAGGHGSDGDADNPAGQTTPGAEGGTAQTRPASPTGGCNGGKGGNGNGTLGGSGGDAGGAIYVASGMSIILGGAGVIDTGGHGGYEGGDNGDAGGGGGAGGMILLESKTVTVGGILVANGGGGGEGNTNGNRGENGQRSASKAKGGKSGDSAGGDGGDGGADTTLAGETTTDLRNGGGGGGGGGVGYIAIACPAPTTAGGVISPSFAAWP